MGTGSGLCRECSARRDGSYTYTKDMAIQTSEALMNSLRVTDLCIDRLGRQATRRAYI